MRNAWAGVLELSSNMWFHTACLSLYAHVSVLNLCRMSCAGTIFSPLFLKLAILRAVSS